MEIGLLTFEVFALNGAVLVVSSLSIFESRPGLERSVVVETSTHILVFGKPLLVGLVAVDPLLGFDREFHGFLRHRITWLSQFCISVCEVTLISEGTVLVSLVVATSLGLVLVVNLILVV